MATKTHANTRTKKASGKPSAKSPPSRSATKSRAQSGRYVPALVVTFTLLCIVFAIVTFVQYV